ncbi:MAG: SRPBCC family protein [Caulobacterales bacterium]
MPGIVLDNAFFEGLRRSALDVTEAETLPPACYTDAAFYDFEKRALYDKEWLCVGRESWVKSPGDYFTTSIVDEPIVVSRDRSGVLWAMSSVCQHRAMLVAEGRGNARGFLCPYHHWTYGLNGELINAPEMSKTCDFDKSSVRLPSFKVEIWQGFIFINFNNDAPPLAPRLRAVEDAIANFDMTIAEGPPPMTQKYAWNWKVMFENNNDGYHANRLHRGPLHDFVPSALSSFPNANPEDAGYLRFNGTTHPDASFNATQKALLPIFPKLTDEDRGRMTFANLPPTLSLVMTCDMIIYMILRPDGPESHEMDTGILVAPGAMADPAFEHRMAMNMGAASEIIAQDMHVDALVQVGLRSRFAVRGRYSWQEGAQAQLNRWLVHRYEQTWREIKPAGALV